MRRWSHCKNPRNILNKWPIKAAVRKQFKEAILEFTVILYPLLFIFLYYVMLLYEYLCTLLLYIYILYTQQRGHLSSDASASYHYFLFSFVLECIPAPKALRCSTLPVPVTVIRAAASLPLHHEVEVVLYLHRSLHLEIRRNRVQNRLIKGEWISPCRLQEGAEGARHQQAV